MKISDDYRIKSDSLNVILEERYFPEIVNEKTKEKSISTEPKWKVIGYFSDPKQALKGLTLHKVMSEGMEQFESIVATLDHLENIINDLAI